MDTVSQSPMKGGNIRNLRIIHLFTLGVKAPFGNAPLLIVRIVRFPDNPGWVPPNRFQILIGNPRENEVLSGLRDLAGASHPIERPADYYEGSIFKEVSQRPVLWPA